MVAVLHQRRAIILLPLILKGSIAGRPINRSLLAAQPKYPARGTDGGEIGITGSPIAKKAG